MGYTSRALDSIREQIAAQNGALTEARERRDSVLSIAMTWPGALRTFQSGSLAHFTVNHPVSDADGGVVLDRRSYPELGPDGDGKGPDAILEDFRSRLESELRNRWPGATVQRTKRALLAKFNSPLDEQQDPSVDLIVALNRKDAEGLWIPNRDTNGWDPSHPEKHTELFRGPSEAVAQVRRRAVRLAKAWNKQFAEPCMCSFNIEAISLSAVAEGQNVTTGLLAIFEQGSKMLEEGEVEDPAGVSGPIRLPMERDAVISRLDSAARRLTKAVEAESEEEARDWLLKLFPDYELPEAEPSKASVAEAIRTGAVFVGSRIAPVPLAESRPVKSVRSWSRKSSFHYRGRQPKVSGFDRPELERFERGLRRAYASIRRVSLRTERLSYSGELDVDHYEPRIVKISFGAYGDPRIPRVTVDGPPQSKHRNGDGSLCIWYPDDPPESKWVWEDGLVALVDLVRVHLFQEAWYRETGEWLGREAPHAA